VRVPVAVARVVRRGPQDPAQLMSAIAAKVPEIASAVLAAAAMTLFAFILTLYLLVDGRSTYEWVIAYVPRAHRAQANETAASVTDAVFAYAAANLITSGRCSRCRLSPLIQSSSESGSASLSGKTFWPSTRGSSAKASQRRSLRRHSDRGNLTNCR
jgi:hypothetical protein